MLTSWKGSYDDAALIQRAAALVETARARSPRYAHRLTQCTTMELSELLRRSCCEVYMIPARRGARAITTPPIGGRYHIGLKEDLDPSERAFALRHELAHVLNGDAEEAVRMVDRGYLTQCERLCDVFALADLFPTSALQLARRARFTWGQIMDEVATEIRESWGREWPPARVEDRARLRVRLFREAGI